MKKYLNEIEIGKYPRPDFRREKWVDLNGLWDFSFDDDNVGLLEGWMQEHYYEKRIIVPFCYQSKASGINETSYHPVVWYHRTFTVNKTSGNVLLHFGAVDYHADVWVNGLLVGKHDGGFSSFHFDITAYVLDGKNDVTLRVEDTNSCEQPRGKQIWSDQPERCWYTATTGIWQQVWIEQTGSAYLNEILIVPNIDTKSAVLKANWEMASKPISISCTVSFRGRHITTCKKESVINSAEFAFQIPSEDPIEEFHHWSPDAPNLYDVEVLLTDDQGIQDQVRTYFGMRKVSVENGNVYLNNRPLYQKMVLDQGYWSEGLMTPPSQKAFYDDILFVKEMGFNGIRMHQKIEDPRFYFWADVLGVVIWEEMPSCYHFSETAMERVVKEWQAVIRRDYNHPSVIVWVPLNESWGVRNIYTSEQQKNYGRMLYYLTKTLDPTRLVSTNDGWEQLSLSDLCSVHDYQVTGESFKNKYAELSELLRKDAQGRLLYATGEQWMGQPVILSEFGGIATHCDAPGSWGYNGITVSAQELEHRYEDLVGAILQHKMISGFCYTQLCDVMQEVNGLLDANHKPKVNIDIIRKINNSF